MHSELAGSGGEQPRHTLLHREGPVERDAALQLAAICHEAACEVELHAGPVYSTVDRLREGLLRTTTALAEAGLLARDPDGAPTFAFYEEASAVEALGCDRVDFAAMLRETGCYAHIEDPSAGSGADAAPTNSLYYTSTQPGNCARVCRRVYADREQRLGIERELLTVQRPLAIDWSRRRCGILPRLEAGILSPSDPPTVSRLETWLDCRISVKGRPNWLFITLINKGGIAEDALGSYFKQMRAFYDGISTLASLNPSIRFHYATAREAVNMIHAAEAAHSGDPAQFRDYRLKSNGSEPQSGAGQAA